MVNQVLPSVKVFFSADGDRIYSLASSLTTHVIGPILKHRPKAISKYHAQVYEYTMEMLAQFSLLSVTSKAWKRDVWDHFMSERFFEMSSESELTKWCLIIRSAASSELDKLVDCLSNVMPF